MKLTEFTGLWVLTRHISEDENTVNMSLHRKKQQICVCLTMLTKSNRGLTEIKNVN